MKHYLVTGGAGFIGAHLVAALLTSGHRVTVIDDLSGGSRDALPDSPQLIFLRADAAEERSYVDTLKAGVDGVFHLACRPSVQYSFDEPLAAHRSNALATLAMLSAVGANGIVPIVFASSAAVYGDAKTLPLKEDASVAALAPYGVDKYASECYGRTFSAQSKASFAALRFFNVFGPGQSAASPYSGVISRFAEATLAQKPVTIFGDGKQTRDFIYVGDVVNALIGAMTKLRRSASPSFWLANVCAGKERSILELAHALGARDIQFAAARSDDIRHSCGDNSAMRAEGWKPQTSFEDGLAATLDWLKTRRATAA